jgi:hypothetical protein
MSDNLTLLRTQHCRPAGRPDPADKGLFALERQTEAARRLRSPAPEARRPYLELDPAGLKRTYRDGHTGLPLPVFAVFNLEGSPQLHAYIGAVRRTRYGAGLSLANHLPFEQTQQHLKALNGPNLRAWRVALGAWGLLAGGVALAALLGPGGAAALATAAAGPGGALGALGSGALLAGASFGATLLVGLRLSAGLINRACPPQTLSLSASFEGLLPAATRAKALRARAHFDQLYLVVDQQARWQSALLPVPASVLLDPLLVGEKREHFRSRYYLLDQFELTQAEDYLASEFLWEPPAPRAAEDRS